MPKAHHQGSPDSRTREEREYSRSEPPESVPSRQHEEVAHGAEPTSGFRASLGYSRTLSPESVSSRWHEVPANGAEPTSHHEGSPDFRARSGQRDYSRTRSPESVASRRHKAVAHGAEPTSHLESWLQRLEELNDEQRLVIAGMRGELGGKAPCHSQHFSWPGQLMPGEALSSTNPRGEDGREAITEIELGLDALGSQSVESPVATPSSHIHGAACREGSHGSGTSSRLDPSSRHFKSQARSGLISYEMTLPTRAFVVNLRRLMASLELLGLLHEFVKSTAIAAFTIVAGGSLVQLRNTVMFLIGVFILYTEHETNNDYLNIDDFKTLVRHYPGEPSSDNPNQVLKAMETRTAREGPLMKVLSHVVILFMLGFTWLNSTAWYNTQCNEDDCDDVSMKRYVVRNQDDLEFASMQVIVLSVMYIFCCMFNAIHFYEMGLCMPKTKGGEAWDVRFHGLPTRFRCFGLPSMWFSTKEAKDDMRKWVDALRPNTTVYQIFPEELGLLAIDGDEEMRNLVVANLKHAKLYNARSGDEVGEALSIDLCYFTLDYHSKEMEHPGTFMRSSGSDFDYSRFQGRFCAFSDHSK